MIQEHDDAHFKLYSLFSLTPAPFWGGVIVCMYLKKNSIIANDGGTNKQKTKKREK